jgi:hypothetical protein
MPELPYLAASKDKRLIFAAIGDSEGCAEGQTVG